jgi:hypothetical protein
MKQKKIIELENKVQNYKPKTNLMIAEYKKQLQKIKTIILEILLFWAIYKIENKKKLNKSISFLLLN